MPSTPSLKPSTRPSTSSSDPTPLNLPIKPPANVRSRKRRGRRIPVITLDAFIAAHNNERLIRYAVEPPRRDSVPVGRNVIAELTNDGVYPYANNSQARIAWAQIAEAESRNFANSAPEVQFYFATLTLAEFMETGSGNLDRRISGFSA